MSERSSPAMGTTSNESDILNQRLREAEDTLQAIRNGEVDALLIESTDGLQTYTLTGADRPYRVMVETMQEGAITVGEDGSILYANRRFSDMLQVPLEHIIGQSLLQFVPEESSAALFPLIDARMGGSRKAELSLLQKNGEKLPVHITASDFLVDGSPVHCLVVMDLTHQRHREALQDVNRVLEERVQARTMEAEQRARQLQVLAGELSRAEQQERKRVAQLLHDGLQQILVAAKMRVDLMLHQVESDTLRENLAQVLNLLSESIASSRSLTVELSPPILFDRGLFPALDWLSRHFEEEHLLDVGVEIAHDAEEPLDEEIGSFLFQAVRELLFNTVKYGNTRGAHVRAYSLGQGQICIEVSDDGVGCDLESALSGREKRGFGLFSIQQRVDLFGGKLELSSGQNEGFWARLTLPKHSSLSVMLPESEEASLTGNGAQATEALPLSRNAPDLTRVLLVDDHKVLRDGISMLLRSQPDIQVVGEAGDGHEALACARQLQPDVVVMDVSMPGMSGLEATRRISAEFPSVRIIALSMHEESDMASAMISVGAECYLAKDGPAEHLIQAIRGNS